MAPILGALFAILVGILSVPSLINWQNQAKNNVNAGSVAQQSRQIIQASTQYIQTNATALQATATASTPVTVSIAQLQAAGLLPAAFKATNLYNQTWQLQVLQPTAGNLQGLAVTTGGAPLSDTQAMLVAKLVGYEGGFFPKNDTGMYPGGAGNAYGANWGPLSATGYTNQAGHMALLINFSSGQLTDNRLYRNAVPGQPQLNTMTTPLIMASVQTENATCPTLSAFASDNTGALLTCSTSPTGNIWKKAGSSSWLAPVANYASLPAAGDPVGAVRMTIDTGRAFMWTGTSWWPLAADQNGNLAVPGNISANTLRPTLVAVEGNSCAGYPEGTAAQSATSSGVWLSCQYSSWKRAAGNAGTGLRGIFAPLANKSTSCVARSSATGAWFTAVASVDANGTPNFYVTNGYSTSYCGTLATCTLTETDFWSNTISWTATLVATGIGGFCQSVWPIT